ncbi:MAG TPA: chitobiase/beta-hexosaminidase C-terminal domain-containing protein [Terracidiphilus sp.]
MAKLSAEQDLAKAKEDRNSIVYSLMGEIDKVYGEFDIRLHSGKAMQAVSFDSLTLGLSTAASITTHSATKTILSALGTGIGGIGQSVDKNFFASQTFQVLSVAMANRREKIRTVIVSNLTTQDVATYPLSAAKRDLVAYYYAGTIAGGLDELQQEASAASKSAVSQTVATPVMDPIDGIYKTAPIVSIICSTPGATIYYTTDNSMPTKASSTYSSPIQTKDGETIKAVGVLPGSTDSQVASATFKIDAANGLDPAAKTVKPAIKPATSMY